VPGEIVLQNSGLEALCYLHHLLLIARQPALAAEVTVFVQAWRHSRDSILLPSLPRPRLCAHTSAHASVHASVHTSIHTFIRAFILTSIHTL